MAETTDDTSPAIAFSEPTDKEKDQIKLALGEGMVTGNDLQALFCDDGTPAEDDGTPAEDDDLWSLYRYDSPPERIPDSARIIAPNWEDGRTANGNDYASFGDDGTTVTVNAHGSIMQITRSLGYGRSGLFCVNANGICGPITQQSRLEKLMKLSKSHDDGIRLKVIEGYFEGTHFTRERPKMEFIYNRWPRFTSQSDTKESEVTSLQYFCHNGTVFQKYTFNHDPKAASAFRHKRLYIQRKFPIRTLDFVNDSAFNNAHEYSPDYDYISGPHKHSHVTIHRMTQKSAKELGINPSVYHHDSGPKAVALIITAFANGTTQSLDPIGLYLRLNLSGEVKREIKNSGSVDITIAYRLQVLTSNPSWKQSLVPASALSSMGEAFSEDSGKGFQSIRWSSQDHMNFIIGRNLEHILSVCSIPMPKPLLATNREGLTFGKDGMKDPEDQTNEEDKKKNEADEEEEEDETKNEKKENWNEQDRMDEEDEEYVVYEQDEMDTTFLALTCGDMSGHRVASTAAFFAFKFLIEILKYLCDTSKEAHEYLLDPKRCRCKDELFLRCETCRELDSYLHHLRFRIMKALEAHLSWSTRAIKATPHVPHYWITGKEIRGWQNHRYLLPASLTDIPFEIIKVHSLHQFYKTHEDIKGSLQKHERDHMKILNDLENQQALNERLGTCIQVWVKKLYRSDKRCNYAFSRRKKDGVHRYHLADHVWIFRAFKCIEALRLGDFLKLKGDVPYLEYLEHKEKGKADEFNNTPSEEQDNRNWSANLQRVILKRFTTRNPQSQQRMLATSRTVSETRFLFHAKDTALFYAMDDGFFDRIIKTHNGCINWTNKISVWKETVDAQPEHEETQTLEWEKPLWYALALVISSRRKRINKISADEMLHTAVEILFALSSSSGLFPGFLTEKREPIPFEDETERDKYWHATFEIPYALWMYGNEHLEASHQSSWSTKRQAEINRLRDGNQLHQPMKKKTEFTTFDSSIDKKRLVEVSDDWLREAPSSLNFDSEISFSPRLSDMMRLYESSSSVIGSVLLHDTESPDDKPTESKGTVFDVPKTTSSRTSRSKGLGLRKFPVSNKEIQMMLQDKRTAQNAKKRLIWLPRADKVTALKCYLAAAEMERDNLSAFFDRHASYEKHFSDGTSAALNEWTTEFHLSYFRKSSWNSSKQGIPEKSQSTIPELSLILVDPRVVTPSRETDGTKIVRSVMSFRFVGDFFDRYWTCHFLECDPTNQSENQQRHSLGNRLSALGTKQVKDVKNPEKRKQPWQQRKVLELLLFEYIIRQIKSSTEELLSWVRKVVLEEERISTIDGIEMASILEMPFGVQATKPTNPLAKALQAGVQSLVENSSDGYFSTVERWRCFDQVLQAIEEDLSGNLETISLWSSREKDREAERPRWTKNDEMTYRQVMNKLHVMNQRDVRDLYGLRGEIQTFRNTITGKMEKMRSDLEYRGSENITLFTYVTVVFLPLGFATGVFSMSNTPDQSTLVGMIQLALIAMTITLFALSNAKTTGKTIVQPIILICRYINNRLLNPLLQPFRIVGNIILCTAMAIEFTLQEWFYLFLGFPLLDLLKRGAKALGIKWILGPIKMLYEEHVDIKRRVLAKQRDWDPAKSASKKRESERPEKPLKDEESGFMSDPEF